MLVIMQANSSPDQMFYENQGYTASTMARKLTKNRPRQGARLAELRHNAGLSQAELARIIGESQQNIAFWEQNDKPPKSEVLIPMAKALGVSVEEILTDKKVVRKTGGPVGKLKKTFDEVSKLPRRQQDKIIEFVSALVNQYKKGTS